MKRKDIVGDLAFIGSVSYGSLIAQFATLLEIMTATSFLAIVVLSIYAWRNRK